MLNKVPEVTLTFWIIKIISTTVGETGADWLAVHVGLGAAIAAGIMVSLLIIMLFLQFRSWRYVPWRYWSVIMLVSVVGTRFTDGLTDGWNISRYVSTTVFALLLAATFATWYFSERTLSIYTITTTRRELIRIHGSPADARRENGQSAVYKRADFVQLRTFERMFECARP